MVFRVNRTGGGVVIGEVSVVVGNPPCATRSGPVRPLPRRLAVPEFLDLHGRTTTVIRVAADAAMRRHGLRLGQDHLLAALWEQDGRTPGDVAAATNVTTPAVTKVVARMVEAGLLTRRRDERDNR